MPKPTAPTTAKKDDAPTAKPEAAAASKASAKSDKPKAKSKKKESGVHSMYKVESDKVNRARPTCERCGPGYFMGDHHDRYTCGHCGFTRYKQK